MKITFKDGKSIENIIKNVSIATVRKENRYTPIVNIVFNKSIGFTDVEEYITEDNISYMEIVTANGETSTLIGFNRIYMSENISDKNHTFIVSLEKH